VALFTPAPKAAKRVLEFFTAQIDNHHTRKAYLNVARRPGLGPARRRGTLSTSPPSSRICRGNFPPPTVKQHLAALRMLFDWLVTGHAQALGVGRNREQGFQ
jgi:hypothetical protein